MRALAVARCHHRQSPCGARSPSLTITKWGAALACLLGIACSRGDADASLDPVPILAARYLGADSQAAPVRTELALPLRIRVTRRGLPLEGIIVAWSASGGTLVGNFPVTDHDGVSEVRWILGDRPGTDTALAVAAGANGAPVRFLATGLGRPGEDDR